MLFSLYSKTTVIDSESVKNIAARDAYDLLSKISTVHGISYGIIGQPVMFSRAGKASTEISLYIDGIYYGKSLTDLSFLSPDQIDRIVLDDRSVENSGMSISIFTKSFDAVVPVTDIKYRDAFFNYRDLSADIFQHVTKDFSFLISGEIFNWKDNRDSYDDFKFPYEKQNYRVKLLMPEMKYTKPVLDISYRIEDKYLLAYDSSLTKTENIRSALYFDNNISNSMNNRFSAVHVHEINDNTSNFFSFYDTFTFADSLSRFEGKTGFDTHIKESSLIYVKADYKKISVIDYGLNGYFGINDNSDNIMSVHLDLTKDFSFLAFETTHGYFSDYTKVQDIEVLENMFTLKKDIEYNNFNFQLGAGYDMFNYAEDPSDVPESLNGSADRSFYRLEFSTDYKSMIRFTNEYIRSASGKIYDTVFLNNLSAITFSDKYFNDRLTVNLAFNHTYSEYLVGNSMQYANNLSFNFRARIVNFELFFGSDNFLKDKYEFNDQFYEVNKHYNYRTVDGFNMRTMDEIWGVRWIFYQ